MNEDLRITIFTAKKATTIRKLLYYIEGRLVDFPQHIFIL